MIAPITRPAASSHQRIARRRAYFAKSTSCSASGSKPRGGGVDALTTRDCSRRPRWCCLRTLLSLAAVAVTPVPAARLDRVDPRVAEEEEPLRVARDRDEVAVREPQHDPSRAGVHADDAMRERARVRDAVDHRRRAGDRAARVDAPEQPAARGGERVEGPVVRAEEDAAVPDRRRGVDVTARAEAPELVAAGAERVELVADGRDEDAPVRDVGRPVDLAVRLADPARRPGARTQRPQPSGVVADVERVPGDRGARGDLRSGVLAPAELV